MIIVQRGEHARCLPLLLDRVADHPRIRIIPEHHLVSVQAHGARLRLALGSDLGVDTLAVDRVVIAIGRIPDLDILSRSIREQEESLAATGRLFIVGDAVRGICRQASIAVGDGVLAAMRIGAENRLQSPQGERDEDIHENR